MDGLKRIPEDFRNAFRTSKSVKLKKGYANRLCQFNVSSLLSLSKMMAPCPCRKNIRIIQPYLADSLTAFGDESPATNRIFDQKGICEQAKAPLGQFATLPSNKNISETFPANLPRHSTCFLFFCKS
jgi:hypothetical protein